jgi:DNA-3-methyladenine glycosylase II
MTALETHPHDVAVRHLVASDPRMAALVARVGRCSLPVPVAAAAVPLPALPREGSARHYEEDHFAGLVEAIVSQQLSPRAASTIFGRVRDLALHPSGRLDPSRLLGLREARLREAGLSGAKTRAVHDLAARVQSGALALETLETGADAEVIASLCEVRGIGRWTAEMFLIFRLGRLDILPVGDLGVQKGFVKLFNLRKPPTPERMAKLARPFRPYRSVACWYLWRLNDEKPVARATGGVKRAPRPRR